MTHRIAAKIALGMLIAACVLAWGTNIAQAQKQASTDTPYASIGASDYRGPNRETSYDLTGPVIRVGLIVPLHGPEKPAGEAILAAAQLAIKSLSRSGGKQLELVVADESVPPWGVLGDEIVNLVLKDHVIAIVTSTDGVAAHLCEQIGTKIGVPTLTLSSDPTTTEINLPWVFRIGPSDKAQSEAVVQQLYRTRTFQKVFLVTANSHDGRIGEKEFMKAMARARAPHPICFRLNSTASNTNSAVAAIKAASPQATVLWINPSSARRLVPKIVSARIRTDIYVSQATFQAGSDLAGAIPSFPVRNGSEHDVLWTTVSQIWGDAAEQSFARRYEAVTHSMPSPAAASAYDAIRLIARALRATGPNRARVRDELAKVRNFAGASGRISFDGQGNDTDRVHLIRLSLRRLPKDSARTKVAFRNGIEEP